MKVRYFAWMKRTVGVAEEEAASPFAGTEREVVEVVDEDAETAVVASVEAEDEAGEAGEGGFVAFDGEGLADAEGATDDDVFEFFGDAGELGQPG